MPRMRPPAPGAELTAPAALCGAGEETRTPDLLITNQLLYQLSYTGKAGEYRTGVEELATGGFPLRPLVGSWLPPVG